MASWDYFVGFEKKPKDLDSFLDRQGYDRVSNEGSSSNRNFESRGGRLVELFFCKAAEVKEGEVPDWKRSGFNITSELMISTKDSRAADEALRLAIEIVKRYNGVLCDPCFKLYSRREEL